MARTEMRGDFVFSPTRKLGQLSYRVRHQEHTIGFVRKDADWSWAALREHPTGMPGVTYLVGHGYLTRQEAAKGLRTVATEGGRGW